MIVLPSRPDRAWLRSFGLAAAALSGLVAGLALGVGAGVATVSLVALAAALAPAAFRRAYALYNRIAGRFVRLARQGLLAICFHTIFLAAGRAGSTLAVRPPVPGGSLWAPRATLSPRAYSSVFTELSAPSRPGWPMSFVRWALKSRNPWAVALLPFLLLLRILDPEPSLDVRGNIYTMY